MENKELLDNFEKTLQMGLMRVCSGAGLLGDELLSSEDIDSKWEEFIKDYVADAVENFNEYPEAALAWAGFLGMAVGNRGWDDMDEHILHGVLGLDLQGKEAKKISDTLQSCALATLGLIRHEGIEAQTATGFYALSRSYGVFFRIGAALELFRLGYKNVKLN